MKTIKQKRIKYKPVDFIRLIEETIQIERKVRTGRWPNTPTAKDGYRYMTHGDLAKILGLWSGKNWNPNRSRVTNVLTSIYNHATQIAVQCGDTKAAFGRTFRDTKGKRGVGAWDKITQVVKRP
jgi:hypothetical protein